MTDCFISQQILNSTQHPNLTVNPLCLKRRSELDDEKDVMARISSAVWVLRCLAPVRGKGYISSWPDMPLCDDWICLQHQETKVPFKPTPGEIDDMEDVIFYWLYPLSVDDKNILWKRAGGMGWKRLAFENNTSVRTVQRRVHKILQRILTHLKKGAVIHPMIK